MYVEQKSNNGANIRENPRGMTGHGSWSVQKNTP